MTLGQVLVNCTRLSSAVTKVEKTTTGPSSVFETQPESTAAGQVWLLSGAVCAKPAGTAPLARMATKTVCVNGISFARILNLLRIIREHFLSGLGITEVRGKYPSTTDFHAFQQP